MPAFSPDGKQIAFAWNGGDREILDVYVKLVGEGEPVRLTKNEAASLYPVFSPDGKRIAFSRSFPSASEIYLISALGGAERKIAEVQSGGTSFSFSPDGKTLAVADRDSESPTNGIIFINVETGAKQKLTHAPENFNDNTPRFSPDGKSIVFVRSGAKDDQDLFIVSAAGGEVPRRLTFDRAKLSGQTWSADGGQIIFSSMRGGSSTNLWQIAATGGEPEFIKVNGKNPIKPIAAPDGKTLFYSKGRDVPGLWRVPATGGDELPVPELAEAKDWRFWAVTQDGIYFAVHAEQPPYKIKFYDFTNRQISEIAATANLPTGIHSGLSASADGKTILYAQHDQNASSIMLAELGK